MSSKQKRKLHLCQTADTSTSSVDETSTILSVSTHASTVVKKPTPLLPPQIPFDEIVLVVNEFVPSAVIHALIVPYVEQRNNCYVLYDGNGYVGHWEVYIWNTKAEVVDCCLKMNPSNLLNLLSDSTCYLSLNMVHDSCLMACERGKWGIVDMGKCIQLFEYCHDRQPSPIRQLTIDEMEHRVASPDSDFYKQCMVCLSSEKDHCLTNLSTTQNPGMIKYVFVVDVSDIPDMQGGNAPRHFLPTTGEKGEIMKEPKWPPEDPPEDPYAAIRILNYYDGEVDVSDPDEDDPRIGTFYYGKNIIPTN